MGDGHHPDRWLSHPHSKPYTDPIEGMLAIIWLICPRATGESGPGDRQHLGRIRSGGEIGLLMAHLGLNLKIYINI
jgi:hypothetical protein